MAYTQTDLDKLKAALANGGVGEVEFKDGRRVRYRSVDEINQAIAAVKAELGIAAKTYKRQQRVMSDKGL